MCDENCGRQHVEINWMDEGRSRLFPFLEILRSVLSWRIRRGGGTAALGNHDGSDERHCMETQLGPSSERHRVGHNGYKLGRKEGKSSKMEEGRAQGITFIFRDMLSSVTLSIGHVKKKSRGVWENIRRIFRPRNGKYQRKETWWSDSLEHPTVENYWIMTRKAPRKLLECDGETSLSTEFANRRVVEHLHRKTSKRQTLGQTRGRMDRLRVAKTIGNWTRGNAKSIRWNWNGSAREDVYGCDVKINAVDMVESIY